jgi:hypothetical protein
MTSEMVADFKKNYERGRKKIIFWNSRLKLLENAKITVLL